MLSRPSGLTGRDFGNPRRVFAPKRAHRARFRQSQAYFRAQAASPGAILGVVVLEYASEGRVVSTGGPYANRYISVLTITDRKVTHWRDYLDPVAVFDALGWPSR